MVFVSLSMPKAALAQWVHQAGLIGAPLVLRGFVDNSLSKTKAAISKKLGKNITGFVINPNAFEQYHIQTVPALVVLNEQNQTQYDVVYGNVNLFSLLKIIEDNGGAGAATAKSLSAIAQGDTDA